MCCNWCNLRADCIGSPWLPFRNQWRSLQFCYTSQADCAQVFSFLACYGYGRSEMSVTSRQPMSGKIPGERRPKLHGTRSLKFCASLTRFISSRSHVSLVTTAMQRVAHRWQIQSYIVDALIDKVGNVWYELTLKDVRWRRGGVFGCNRGILPYNFVTSYDEVIMIENFWKLFWIIIPWLLMNVTVISESGTGCVWRYCNKWSAKLIISPLESRGVLCQKVLQHRHKLLPQILEVS